MVRVIFPTSLSRIATIMASLMVGNRKMLKMWRSRITVHKILKKSRRIAYAYQFDITGEIVFYVVKQSNTTQDVST
jgi:hypothetical protein